jgi:hypothetical protein
MAEEEEEPLVIVIDGDLCEHGTATFGDLHGILSQALDLLRVTFPDVHWQGAVEQ